MAGAKIGLLLAVLTVLAPTGDAIKCYVCTSTSAGSACGTSAVHPTSRSVTIASGCTACQTLETVMSSEPHIDRSCKSYMMEGFGKTSCCSADFCNDGSATSSGSGSGPASCYECESTIAGGACASTAFDPSSPYVTVSTGCNSCKTLDLDGTGARYTLRRCSDFCLESTLRFRSCTTDLCNGVAIPSGGASPTISCYECTSYAAGSACDDSAVDASSPSVTTVTGCAACQTITVVKGSGAPDITRTCAPLGVSGTYTRSCCSADLCNDGSATSSGNGSSSGPLNCYVCDTLTGGSACTDSTVDPTSSDVTVSTGCNACRTSVAYGQEDMHVYRGCDTSCTESVLTTAACTTDLCNGQPTSGTTITTATTTTTYPGGGDTSGCDRAVSTLGGSLPLLIGFIVKVYV